MKQLLTFLLCSLVSLGASGQNQQYITLLGKITQPLQNTKVIVQIRGQNHPIEVDDTGEFYKKIALKPSKNTQVRGWVRYGYHRFPLRLENQSRLRFTVDAKSGWSFFKTIRFTGDNAALHDYLTARVHQGFREDVPKGKLSFEAYRKKVEERKKLELNLLKQYTQQETMPANYAKAQASRLREFALFRLCRLPDAYLYKLPKLDFKAYASGRPEIPLLYTGYVVKRRLNESKKTIENEKYYQLWYQMARQKVAEGIIKEFVLYQILEKGFGAGYVEKLGEELKHFKKKYQKSRFLPQLTNLKSQTEALLKGTEAPDFTFTNLQGQKVTLSDFKGKVIYLDFWATWCKPCMREMPYSKKVQNHFKDRKDLVFVFVSMDDDLERWKFTIEQKQITGVHLVASKTVQQQLNKTYIINGIPAYYLIDSQGKFAVTKAKHPSNVDLIQDIEKLLKK